MCQLSVKRAYHRLKGGIDDFGQPKNKYSIRNIALSPNTIAVLRAHQAKTNGTGSQLVFTLNGKRVNLGSAGRFWKIACKRAGVKHIRFHDARHTHATLMLQADIHPKVVQERLGHSSIKTTLDTYSHVVPGMQERAAKAFDDVLANNS